LGDVRGARFVLGRVTGLQGGGEYGQDAHNPDGYYAQGNHNFEQTEAVRSRPSP